MSDTCICGDVRDEHGGDPKFPRSTACTIECCECVAFEEDPDADDDCGDGHSEEEPNIVHG